MNILCFGEILWDVYPAHRVIGGASLNFAGHCALGGLDSYLYSAVGKDELGDAAYGELARLGIHSEFVLQSAHATGQCLVTLDENAIPSYRVLTDTAYDNIEEDAIPTIRERHFDALYFGTLSQRNPTSRKTLLALLKAGHFGEIFCDLNLRDGCYDKESVKNCLENATVLKFSDEEAPRLREYAFWRALEEGDLMNNLFAAYGQLAYILYTCGKDGSVIYARNAEAVRIPAAKTQVVSTVGAGDSFGATWLCRHLSGDSAEDAARVAAKVSGYVVSVQEAVPSYKIEAFL